MHEKQKRMTMIKEKKHFLLGFPTQKKDKDGHWPTLASLDFCPCKCTRYEIEIIEKYTS